MKPKTVRIEELGLDLKNFDNKDLEYLALFIEQCLKDELGKLLNERLISYISTISVEIINDIIRISIDLEADSYVSPYISLEKILEQVLRHVFDRTKQYLVSKYKKTTGIDNKF
jgi:hypothetical protein